MLCCFPRNRQEKERRSKLEENIEKLKNDEFTVEGVVPGVNTPTVSLKLSATSSSNIPQGQQSDRNNPGVSDEYDGSQNSEDLDKVEPISGLNSEVPIADQTPAPTTEQVVNTKTIALQLINKKQKGAVLNKL